MGKGLLVSILCLHILPYSGFYGLWRVLLPVRQKAISGQNMAIKLGSFLYGIRNYGRIMGVKICFSCFMEL